MKAPTSLLSFSIGTRHKSPQAAKFDGCDDYRFAFSISLRCCYIGDVNHLFGRHHATIRGFSGRD